MTLAKSTRRRLKKATEPATVVRSSASRQPPSDYRTDLPVLLVDPSTGSGDLMLRTPFTTNGVKTKLRSADIAFTNHDGSLSIGIELKSLNDLLASIATGRLGGTQIPRMLEDYDEVVLLYYGYYKAGAKGELLVGSNGSGGCVGYSVGGRHGGNGRMAPYSYLAGALSTISKAITRIGSTVEVVRVGSKTEAVAWIDARAAWHQRPEHRSMRVFDKSRDGKGEGEKGRDGNRSSVIMPAVDDVLRQRMRFASACPNIGYEKALAIAQQVGSGEAQMKATVEELSQVRVREAGGKERRVGVALAKGMKEAQSL